MVKYEGDNYILFIRWEVCKGKTVPKVLCMAHIFSEIPLFKLGKRSRKEQCDA